MKCCDRCLDDYTRIMLSCCLKHGEAEMPDQPPLIRQWILLRMLCAKRHGMTVKEMVAEMDVSEKTIRRDLETFQAAGFPLQEQVGDFGRKHWQIDRDRAKPGLSFLFDEAIALYMGRRFLEPLAGTIFWQAAQRAFQKIRATLGTEVIDYMERFGTTFYQTTVGASYYSKKDDLIDTLMIGIEDQKAIFITYQSLRSTEPVTYDVYPYGLTYHRGSLYLIGKAPEKDEIRHWKVDRIEAAETTQVQFIRPGDFDLTDHLSKSFGVFQGDEEVEVRVRFSAEVARYVQESNWHHSQQLEEQGDGSVEACFTLDHTEEIKRWLLSFGRHAVVIEPLTLREEIIEELDTLISLYATEDSQSPLVEETHPKRSAK